MIEITTYEDPDKITAYVLDSGLTADNVLKYQIGELKAVSLVGINKKGQYVYSSSVKNPYEVMDMIKKFKKVIKGYT